MLVVAGTMGCALSAHALPTPPSEGLPAPANFAEPEVFPIRLAAPQNLQSTVLPKRKRKLRIKPEWASQRQLARQTNLSYLADQERQARLSKEAALLDQLFADRKTTLEYRYRYERIQREFEAREAYHYGGVSLETDYLNKMGRLRDDAVKRFPGDATKRQGKILTNRAQKSGAVEEIGVPGQALAVAAGVSLGKPLSVRFSDSTHLYLRSMLQKQTAVVQFSTPLFESRVDYAGRNSDSLDSYDPQDRTVWHPESRRERYRLRLSRNIPGVDMNSALIYGGTTQLMSASLSKQLTPQIRAEVATSHATTSDPRAQGIEQESVSLLYDVRF